jgi:NADPH:quinone reductase-like Zn-dependent oxidoreductase
MKAAFMTQFGEPSEIVIGDLPKPVPEPEEVLIKVKCAAVNPIDWKLCQGALGGVFPHNFPLTPGWDASGIIEQVGNLVNEFQVGDAVLAETFVSPIQKGSFAEYICVPASFVAKKPESMSFEEAAALPLVSLTAYQAMVEHLQMSAGSTVLITGAGGGVGHVAVQIAKALGAQVIATTSEQNIEFVRSLGADIVLDYSSESYQDQLAKTNLKSIGYIFHTSKGPALAPVFQFLNNGVKICSIAGKLDADLLASKEMSFCGMFVMPKGEQLKKLVSYWSERKLAVEVTEVFELNDIAIAFDRNRNNKKRNKVVVKIS